MEVHEDGQLAVDDALREVVVVLHVEGHPAAGGMVGGEGPRRPGGGACEEQWRGGGQEGGGDAVEGQRAELPGGEGPGPTEEEPLSHLGGGAEVCSQL